MDTKQCSTCKRLLPITEFYMRCRSEEVTRPKRRRQSSCKDCMKASKKKSRSDPEKRAAEYRANKAYRIRNSEKFKKVDRKNNLLRCFGIAVEEYERLFDAQQGLCAVCGKPETAVLRGKTKRLAVDHDHDTGQVRGLLCSRCNTAIGLMDDDVDILAKAQCYLLLPIANPISGRSQSKRTD